MELKKYIFRYLSLLLLCCVFTTQISVYAFDNVQVCQTNTDDDNDDGDQAYFAQISSETVVPSHDFSFNNLNKFFSVEDTFFHFTEPTLLSEAYFIAPINTYFIKLFGHHIAINAP